MNHECLKMVRDRREMLEARIEELQLQISRLEEEKEKDPKKFSAKYNSSSPICSSPVPSPKAPSIEKYGFYCLAYPKIGFYYGTPNRTFYFFFPKWLCFWRDAMITGGATVDSVTVELKEKEKDSQRTEDLHRQEEEKQRALWMSERAGQPIHKNWGWLQSVISESNSSDSQLQI
ncbi:unnamed protein product [Caenorhabditis sp. 36 PRJEB53466]|nr:unnamed protein product [Caenorhabditis sp. 36 PRJEB53466]